MKKVFTLLIACVLLLTLLCGCNNTSDNEDENVYVQEGEDIVVELTDDEIIDFNANGKQYPENFIFAELQDYGRVIASASSREDAISTAREHFNSGWCTTVECRLTVETDLFYGLYVKWDYRINGVGEPVSYYDEYVVSFKKNVYDFENNQFFTKNADIIKSILNYTCYDHYIWLVNKVYSSDIIKNGDKYKYIAYGLSRVRGDWGMQDALCFLKLVVEIDLATGKTSKNVETIKLVYVDGALTHFE